MPTPPPFLLGGIQVNEDDQAAWCEALVNAGFNTLQVTVYAIQGDWDSADLHVDPVDEGTVKKIRAARAAGLHVALILRVHTDHAHPRNRFLWHGLTRPADGDTLDAWFKRYTAFITQWADVAAAEGVTLLGLGSEMNALASTRPVKEIPSLEAYYLDPGKQSDNLDSIVAAAAVVPPDAVQAPGDGMPAENLRLFAGEKAQALARWAAAASYAFDADGRPRRDRERVRLINDRRATQLAHWRSLIAAARARYPGPLTYAANFDNYHEVAFWPELQAMGVNAYFPLRTPAEPASDAVLEAGWTKVFDELAAHQRTLDVAGKPVVFTELGYTRRDGCTVAPWAWEGFDLVGEDADLMVWAHRDEDPSERVRAMDALRRVNEQRGRPLAGLLYWKLTTVPDHARREAFALRIRPADDARAEAEGFARDPLQDTLLRFVD